MSICAYAQVVDEMGAMMEAGLIDAEDAGNQSWLLSELDWYDYFGE